MLYVDHDNKELTKIPKNIELNVSERNLQAALLRS